ncbi:MAG TPA: SpoIID/LytB domain-containing protein [Solirubrobacteraceae bacterium]|nr:SpoIID/LytB domain-containing protein [Solirubrobacteraceae bacterium]
MRTLSRTAAGAAALACALAAPAHAASPKGTLIIRGAGFGHGVGMSQYGAYGYAQHGWTYDNILAHYYTGTQLGRLDPEPDVSVILQAGQKTLRVSGVASAGGAKTDPAQTYVISRSRKSGDVLVRDASGTSVARAGGPISLAPSPAGPIVLGGTAINGVRGGAYRGTLTVRPAGDGGSGLDAVDTLDLEDYVRGVVAGESPSSWPIEALKAQAVAARTFAVTSGSGELWPDTRSQMYLGVSGETASTDLAVASTAGQVVTFFGKPVVTYFFSTSGGHTENVENSMIGSSPEPWLKGVDDPYDNTSPKHRWGPIRLSFTQAARELRGLVQGRFVRIKVLQRGVSPRIVRALIVGSRGTTAVTGPQLRTALGLWDSWMTFRTISSGVKRVPTPPAPTPPPDPQQPSPTGGASSGSGSGAGNTDGSGGATASAARLSPLYAVGTISPARRGAWARVQVRRGKAWRLAVDTQVGRGGRYSVRLPGRGTYRVVYGHDVGPTLHAR